MKSGGTIKSINWKIINFAFYFELVVMYFLPFKAVDEHQYQVGFPFPFLTIYDRPITSVNLYSSLLLNIVALIVDIVIIYLVTTLLLKMYKKIK